MYCLFGQCVTFFVYTDFVEAYLTLDYAALFVHASHFEVKLSKMYVGLYQVISWLYHWAKIGDAQCFNYHSFALLYVCVCVCVCVYKMV